MIFADHASSERPHGQQRAVQFCSPLQKVSAPERYFQVRRWGELLETTWRVSSFFYVPGRGLSK